MQIHALLSTNSWSTPINTRGSQTKEAERRRRWPPIAGEPREDTNSRESEKEGWAQTSGWAGWAQAWERWAVRWLADRTRGTGLGAVGVNHRGTKLRGFTYKGHSRGKPERWHHTYACACPAPCGTSAWQWMWAGVTWPMGCWTSTVIYHLNITASHQWHPDSFVQPAELYGYPSFGGASPPGPKKNYTSSHLHMLQRLFITREFESLIAI